MRPISLKLAGLHSYRERQQVDFETLCEAGLFGIFGPTGSGKSTILDAITLALYGEVVRLGGKTHPKEVLNQLEQRAFVSFTFEIGGTSERKRYTIEREFGLDRKGNRRQPEVRLIECGDGGEIPDQVIESKANAATAAIEALIGLTLQDFTRAVVLPQGQFSKFLTLKGSERNEMLQRMFQLHEYGEKLNDRIRRASEENRREIHRLELELASLGNVGPEAMESAKETLHRAEQQNKLFSEQKVDLERKKRDTEQVYQWQIERAAILQRLEILRAEKADVDEVEKKSKQIDAAITLWPLLEREKALKIACHEKEQLLLSQRVEQKIAADSLEAAEKDHLAAQALLRAEEPLLIEQKSKLEQAKKWEQELSSLQTELIGSEQELSSLRQELAALTQQIAIAEKQLAQSEQELMELDERLQTATVSPEERKRLTELREAKREWVREAAKQQEIEREINSVQLEQRVLTEEQQKLSAACNELSIERADLQQAVTSLEARPVATEQELEKLREELSQVKALGKEWRDQLHVETEWQNKWSTCEQAWQEAEQKSQAAATQLQLLEAQRDQFAVELEQTRHAFQNWQQENLARLLRQELPLGEECPVCGSTHHPYRLNERSHQQELEPNDQNEKFQEQVKEQQTVLTAAERQVREAAEKWQEAKISLAGIEQRRVSLMDERQSIESRVQAIIEECQKLGPDWHVSTIEQLLQSYKEREAAFRLQLEERAQHATLIEQQQQKLTLLRERELQEKGAYETKTALLQQLEEKLDLLQKRGQEAFAQAESIASKLNLLRGELAVEAIEAEYKRLEEMDQQFVNLRQVRTVQETKRKQSLSVWEADKEKRNTLTVRQAALEERFQERKLLWQEKHQLWFALTSGEPAAVLYEQVDNRLTIVRQAASESQQLLQKAMTAKQQVQELLLKTEEAFLQLTQQHKEAELSLHRALIQAGLDRPEILEELYGEREQLSAYQQRVQSYTTQYGQLEYDNNRLTQMIDGREVSDEEHESLQHAWEELGHQLQAAKDEVAIARQTLAQITANHEKWQHLQVSLVERNDEQSRLDELRKLFEGKAFVQYIAEEKLTAIARDASYHLNRMTKNRYALEIGDEGEFVLRDEGAGGIRRPVSTLSGGETFLTSLALALALSVEIQMRGGRLEFFFLDEGFGTLDPELLEVVLDALEKLRMDHFTIGVISHVPEIRVRMPRRLVITPAEPLGVGSRIELERE